MAKNANSDTLRLMDSPAKSRRKVVRKDQFALLKESIQLGCVSQDFYPKKSILRKGGKLGLNHTIKLSKGTWHHIKIREGKRPSRGVIQKLNLTSAIRALPDLSERHKTKPCSKKDAPAE